MQAVHVVSSSLSDNEFAVHEISLPTRAGISLFVFFSQPRAVWCMYILLAFKSSKHCRWGRYFNKTVSRGQTAVLDSGPQSLTRWASLVVCECKVQGVVRAAALFVSVSLTLSGVAGGTPTTRTSSEVCVQQTPRSRTHGSEKVCAERVYVRNVNAGM